MNAEKSKQQAQTATKNDEVAPADLVYVEVDGLITSF